MKTTAMQTAMRRIERANKSRARNERIILDKAAKYFPKAHLFDDGRQITIERCERGGKEAFIIRLTNAFTDFKWMPYRIYYDLQDCIRDAQQVFGITNWNLIN